MMNVICFGASGGGERLFPAIAQHYNIIAYTDNDSKKWGKNICGVKIFPPDICIRTMEYDAVVITSAPGMQSIMSQLISMDVPRGKIISSYVEVPLENRRIFIKSFSVLMKEWDEFGDLAEAGVFEGEFAYYVNYYCSWKILHLFDTFEGFCSSDIEKEKGFSNAQVGDYSNTSVERVLERMPHPENIVIHKGYFPATAESVKNKRFCFVNLDMDLYQPTYQGCLFFSERLTRNGVILVHDYFAENFKGVKEAVDEFLSKNKERFRRIPIGDGSSIMLLSNLSM